MIRGILFDLDGVLYNGEEPIEGAAEAVEAVRGLGLSTVFVTNTTSRPRSAIAEKLRRFGVVAQPDDILTPPIAAARWISQQGPGPVALFVPEATKADFVGLPQVAGDSESGAHYLVVGDLGEAWDFANLNRAFRLLHNDPECYLIALGMTRYWRAADGVSLDAGPFVAALVQASGRPAYVLGKPSRQFFDAACAMLNCEPAEALMVGDDIKTDVAGAQDAGLQSVLVRTGKFRPEDLEGVVEPDAVIDSVRDLPAIVDNW